MGFKLMGEAGLPLKSAAGEMCARAPWLSVVCKCLCFHGRWQLHEIRDHVQGAMWQNFMGMEASVQ